MATWEEIVKANQTIKTTPIHGKNYAEVNQRIKAFRMVYPEGFIITEMMKNENGVCIFKASVGYNDGTNNYIIGTGTAYEVEGNSNINKTSYIENAETSAVGRALGMAGFGIDTSVASAEEVQNAIDQQEKLVEKDIPTDKRKTASEKQIELLKKKYSPEMLVHMMEKNGIDRLEDLPMSKASEYIAYKGKENNNG